jgi:hypothetical protein
VYYRPSTLVAGSSTGGTAQPGSSANSTAWSGRALPLPHAPASTSSLVGAIARQAGATASEAGSSTTRWNQPKVGSSAGLLLS